MRFPGLWHNISNVYENEIMEHNNERYNSQINKAPDSASINKDEAGGIISEYIVEEKDKVSDIAKKYGLSIDEILAANPGLSEPADMIRPGMKICIPRKVQ